MTAGANVAAREEDRLPGAVLSRVAERFRALGEPSRLALLHALRGGERTVTALMESTGLAQANASRHLAVLHGQGYLAKRRAGVNVLYRLRDDHVMRICDVMCSRLESEAEELGGHLRTWTTGTEEEQKR